MRKLVLLDGHAIIHRAFHAIRPLNTSAGELVNAVFGFTSMLLNVLELEQPDCIAVTFDRKGPTFRHREDENYKANRVKAPDELISQIKRVYEIARAFNIPVFAEKGLEADDMLGSIVAKVKFEKDLQTVIVSGDRDLLQLVAERISVHDLTGGYRNAVKFTPAEVEKKYGFGPKFIPDFKGLVGDASDNLKGVTGVGPKSATDLIRQFGSLENIYDNLPAIKETVREKLERDRENAFQTKRMTTIRFDAPLDWNLDKCELNSFDRAEVLHLLEELEFYSLIKRFEKLFPISPEKAEIPQAPETPQATQQSLF
ncbi:MAG: 5'-3' exonuclease H3TH domain-containing protein [Patescibacteria group bacterium]